MKIISQVKYIQYVFINFQVDLAPLMSSLIGTPIPVNSVGVLPIEILSATPIYNFKAAHSNFLQVYLV